METPCVIPCWLARRRRDVENMFCEVPRGDGDAGHRLARTDRLHLRCCRLDAHLCLWTPHRHPDCRAASQNNSNYTTSCWLHRSLCDETKHQESVCVVKTRVSHETYVCEQRRCECVSCLSCRSSRHLAQAGGVAGRLRPLLHPISQLRPKLPVSKILK